MASRQQAAAYGLGAGGRRRSGPVYFLPWLRGFKLICGAPIPQAGGIPPHPRVVLQSNVMIKIDVLPMVLPWWLLRQGNFKQANKQR